MQNNLGIAHFLQNADGIALSILFIMGIMSCGTWYVIIGKSVQLFFAKKQSRRFLERFWSAPNLEEVDHFLLKEGAKDPFSRLVQHGIAAHSLKQNGQVANLEQAGSHEDFLTRSLKRSIEDDGLHAESGLSFVATVASSAPFIGLFGTVWGIYNALMAIGISGQGTLDKVAGPVGEALIMTGIGLVVAIPAAIGYNFFARTNRSAAGRLESFAHDVYTLLSRGVKVPASSNRVLGG